MHEQEEREVESVTDDVEDEGCIITAAEVGKVCPFPEAEWKAATCQDAMLSIQIYQGGLA